MCVQVLSGVISNDSDAFLYGATTVYRKFTASGNTVSIYIKPAVFVNKSVV